MPNKIGSEHLAVIKVVGVGGGGTNAVNRMVEAGVRGVEFIAVNTDRQALLMSDADKTIHIGEELTRGLGAGANPEVGCQAAEESRADIRTVMKDAGTAMMGIGLASGENRALDAAQQATNSNLLEASIAGASRVLFSIAGGPDLTLTEVDAAARTVEACADESANIIYGQIIDEGMQDQVRITVIATGFKMGSSQQSSMDFSRKDLFASTTAPDPMPSAPPVTFSTTSRDGRFADEDYIPDFLKRQR